MEIESVFDRRSLIKWGLLSAAGTAALPEVLGNAAVAQQTGFGPSDELLGVVGGRSGPNLFTGESLRGGGQMEIRPQPVDTHERSGCA